MVQAAKTTTVQNKLLSRRDHKLISRDQARTVAPPLFSGLTEAFPRHAKN